MGPTKQDLRPKLDQARFDQSSRQKEIGSSSQFRKERDMSRNNDQNSRSKVGYYNFNVSTSELVAVLRSMGNKVRWPKK